MSGEVIWIEYDDGTGSPCFDDNPGGFVSGLVATDHLFEVFGRVAIANGGRTIGATEIVVGRDFALFRGREI